MWLLLCPPEVPPPPVFPTVLVTHSHPVWQWLVLYVGLSVPLVHVGGFLLRSGQVCVVTGGCVGVGGVFVCVVWRDVHMCFLVFGPASP